MSYAVRRTASAVQQPVSVPAPHRLARFISQASLPCPGAGVSGTGRRRRSGGPQHAGGAQSPPGGPYHQKDVVQNANQKAGTRKNTRRKSPQRRIGGVHLP